MSPIHVSVVIPVQAETDSLVAVVGDLVRTLGANLFEIHVVLSTSSPAATREISRLLVERYPVLSVCQQTGGPGLGHAVRTGLRRCTGSHVLMIDGDGEMDVATSAAMLEVVAGGDADLVVASRWVRGGGTVGYDRLKWLANRIYQGVFRRLYRTSVHDLTLGYKLGRAAVFESVELVGTRHEIACETTLRPLRVGWTVAEVPTVWTRRTAGASSNRFHRNFRYVWMAISILRHQKPVAGRAVEERR